jgi:hypothetical protein
MRTFYRSDTGTANAYVVVVTVLPILGPDQGDTILFTAATANTGASTLAANGYNGDPVIAIKKQGSTPLASGDIAAGQLVVLIFDGTQWQLFGSSSSSGGGSLIFLEAHTASSSAALNFTASISSSYDEYEIELIGVVPATNGSAIGIQMSTNGGTSYDSSAIYWWQSYAMASGSQGGNGVSGASATVSYFTNNQGNGTGLAVNGRATLFSPLSTSLYKYLVGSFVGPASTGQRIGWQYSGSYENLSAVNAFRIVTSSGNIAAGTVRCYGIAH